MKKHPDRSPPEVMTGLMGDRARSLKHGYWCFISVFLAEYLVETRFRGRTEWGDLVLEGL